jgi:hypothetical protein
MNSPTDYLLLGRSLPSASITVDILLYRATRPNWVMRAIAILRETPGILVRKIFTGDSGENAQRSRAVSPLFAAFHDLSTRACPLFRLSEPDSVRALGLQVVAAGNGWRDLLAADPPDVLLNLTGALPAGTCSGLARSCVWSLVLGDPQEGYSAVPFFRETAGHATTLPVCLVQHSTVWDRGRILHRLQSGKYQSLYYLRAAEEALQNVGAIVARRLHDILIHGGTGRLSPSQDIDVTPRQDPPSNWELARYLAGRFRHSLLTRTVQRNRRKQWFVAWRDCRSAFTSNREQFTAEGFHDFSGRPGLGYADPFPFEWQGRQLLFIEEIMPDERGRLVVTEVAAGREPDNPPAIILDKPYHLSYPFVFEHEGEYYLIPETCQNRTVELYRAVRFPEEWTLHRVLVNGLRLADTTPFFHDERWYFFVTMADRRVVAAESYLFYSDRLDGDWVSHPANPISSDARRLRSAGRLFYRHGRLLRPVQDCSLDYGMAVRLMQIEKLSPDEYAETEVEVIDTSWHPGAIRTHTLNASNGLEAIDGSRWVPAE